MSLIKGCGLGPVEVSTGHVGWWIRVHYPTCPVKISTRHKTCPQQKYTESLTVQVIFFGDFKR